MSHTANNIWWDNREEWLNERGCLSEDIMEDEQGEYIITESDNGSPREDGYDVRLHKVYLPDKLQEGFVPNIN